MPDPQTSASPPDKPKRPPRSPIKRFQQAAPLEQIAIVLGGILVFFVVALLLSVIIGVVTGGSEDVAAVVAIVRDMFIILLAMQAMLITLALIVMILQLASLINLLQNEITPIAKNLQDTSQTLRGTTNFLSENLTLPIIEGRAWAAGFANFVRELRGIRRATQPNGASTPPTETTASTLNPPPTPVKPQPSHAGATPHAEKKPS
ncbi:MAG: hypothetical protein HC915_13595 [Anaerolineae bacterium]|nr:hypothetical protein [Anaerolineae bacterium]